MSIMSRVKETNPVTWLVSLSMAVVFFILILQLDKGIKNLGKPININQLQEDIVYYVNEVLPELDLMVVNTHNQYSTKDLLIVKSIPDSLTKDSRFMVKDGEVKNLH